MDLSFFPLFTHLCWHRERSSESFFSVSHFVSQVLFSESHSQVSSFPCGLSERSGLYVPRKQHLADWFVWLRPPSDYEGKWQARLIKKPPISTATEQCDTERMGVEWGQVACTSNSSATCRDGGGRQQGH